ncbi:MAG: hypothetical protein ACM31C_29465 [Acidobacteriota bacterium]
MACLAIAGSAADASAARRHHHRKLHRYRKHDAPVEPPARVAHDDVVVVTDDPAEPRDLPVAVHEQVAPRAASEWHLAIGPDAWASSVEAKVSLGSQTVTTGIDFMQVEQHVRYGVPLLAEARYGRLSLVTDFTYGVVDIAGARDVGPLMVSVNGTASSLQVDGLAGYRVTGDDHSLLALEARGGVRYQRTSITASLGVDGSPATSFASITGGADALAGARVLVRPLDWLSFSAAADAGVFGTSTTTWSASADTSVRFASRVLLSVGWRTLTTDSASVSVVMHGPRAALQLVF